MFRITHTIRRAASSLAVVACLAGASATSAFAGGSHTSLPSDYWVWLAGPKAFVADGRSPDTRDAAQRARSGRAYTAWLAGPKTYLFDGRSPDTRDAALQAHQATLVMLHESSARR